VADRVRLMLDDLARHGSPVRGQRGEEPDQLERDARRALRRHPLRPLSGFTGSLGAGGGGVARHLAEPVICRTARVCFTGGSCYATEFSPRPLA
jgi:hypothetical protein